MWWPVGTPESSKDVEVRPESLLKLRSLLCCHASARWLLAMAVGPHDDLHVAAECVQEPKQPVDRETRELATHQGRDLGLVDTEDDGGLGLGQLSFGDHVSDSLNQLGLGQALLGVGNFEVGKDIAATGLHLDAFRPLHSLGPHAIPHEGSPQF